MGGNRGTETSKYPEEKKVNKRFRKQWRAKLEEAKPVGEIRLGLGLDKGQRVIDEDIWKGERNRVTAP